MNDIERIKILQTALHKIATDTYTRQDELLASTQPAMIWELVAGEALKATQQPEE